MHAKTYSDESNRVHGVTCASMGPWTVVDGLKPNETRIWASEPRSRIAVVYHRALHDTRGGRGKAGPPLPHRANAALIAAAPALLDALRFYANPIPGSTMDPNVARIALQKAGIK